MHRALGINGNEPWRTNAIAGRLTVHPRGPVPARGQLDAAGRVALFREQATAAGAVVTEIGHKNDVPAAIADILRDLNLPPRLRLGTDPRLAALPWRLVPALEVAVGPSDGDDLVGVSCALAAVAESGTLVLMSGQHNPTTLNFLPDTHIVVVAGDDVVGDYETVWDTLRARFGATVMPRNGELDHRAVALGRHRAAAGVRRPRAAPAAHPGGGVAATRPGFGSTMGRGAPFPLPLRERVARMSEAKSEPGEGHFSLRHIKHPSPASRSNAHRSPTSPARGEVKRRGDVLPTALSILPVAAHAAAGAGVVERPAAIGRDLVAIGVEAAAGLPGAVRDLGAVLGEVVGAHPADRAIALAHPAALPGALSPGRDGHQQRGAKHRGGSDGPTRDSPCEIGHGDLLVFRLRRQVPSLARGSLASGVLGKETGTGALTAV